jgi:hypothetical protein
MSIAPPAGKDSAIYKVWVPDSSNRFAGEYGDFGDTGEWKPCTFDESYADGMARMKRALGYCAEKQYLVARLVLDNIAFAVREDMMCTQSVFIGCPKRMGFQQLRKEVGQKTDFLAYSGAKSEHAAAVITGDAMHSIRFSGYLRTIENRSRFSNIPQLSQEVRKACDLKAADYCESRLKTAENIVAKASGKIIEGDDLKALGSNLSMASFYANIHLKPENSGSTDHDLLDRFKRAKTRIDEISAVYFPKSRLDTVVEALPRPIVQAVSALRHLRL